MARRSNALEDLKSGRPTGFLDASDAVTTLRLSDKECTTGHPRSPPVTVRHQIVTRHGDGGQLDGRPLEIALGDVRIPPGHGFRLVARHPCGPSSPSQPSGRLRCARGCGLVPRSAVRSRIDSVRDEPNRTTSAGSIESGRHSFAGAASSRMAGRTSIATLRSRSGARARGCPRRTRRISPWPCLPPVWSRAHRSGVTHARCQPAARRPPSGFTRIWTRRRLLRNSRPGISPEKESGAAPGLMEVNSASRGTSSTSRARRDFGRAQGPATIAARWLR